MDSIAFNELIDEYLTGNLSPLREKDFLLLLQQPGYRQMLDNRLITDWENSRYEEAGNDAILKSIEENINRKLAETTSSRPVHKVHFLRKGWFRYAAAILFITGIGAYLWNNTINSRNDAGRKRNQNLISNILPGTNKAILILSDGRKIELADSTSSIITDQNLSISNTAGHLSYGSPSSQPNDGGLNTMQTPRGGQYQLTLSDGTIAWLNAASSITYPIVFSENTRSVSITGEVYFEVAKNKSKPFIVKSNDQTVEVLGTSFNINSYADEPFSKTSLISGSVKISGQILQPGQAFSQGRITTTNINKDVAWKNGFFNFDNTSLPAMLRQLSRWYDIDIVYTSAMPTATFDGRIRRDFNLAQILRLLDSLEIKYELKGKTLYIK